MLCLLARPTFIDLAACVLALFRANLTCLTSMPCSAQVAAGAADLYANELHHITHLSRHGAQQLLADLEYFCNVLAALGIPLPPILGTWQTALMWPDEEYMAAANTALETSSVDSAALHRYALVRGFQTK